MLQLRRTNAALLAVFALAAPAAAFQADGGPDFRGSLSFGAGSAHGLLGLSGEFGRGQWAGYFGIALPHVLPNSGLAAGARWFLRNGEGLTVSLGVAYLTIENAEWARAAFADWSTGLVASGRVGWRLRRGSFMGEVGAGPAWVKQKATPTVAARYGPSFDIDVALGFEL